MADDFPDISSKLGGPSKKSVFERQKAEAEAKKARETAETAAVLEDFVKSFDDNDLSTSAARSTLGRPGGTGPSALSNFSAGPGKRHFTSTSLKSGPGSLGPPQAAPKSGAGIFGPGTAASGRKRPYDDFQGRRDRDRSQGMFSYEDDRLESTTRQSKDSSAAFRPDDDDKNDFSKVAAKPTLHLSSLPHGTSPAVIRALFTSAPFTVDDVRILPPPAPSSATTNDRRSTSAIVTLAADTPATDIDTVVSHLQNKYLGFGFNLSISRYLSSAALSGANMINAPNAHLNNLPFGARALVQHTSLSRAPPPGQGGRFAPPASYTSTTPYGRTNIPSTQVSVQPPSDLKQLKFIHKTLEALLTYGPEFEALLMSRPQIQRDEKWAWLWDSRSAGGVYYRWRLWDILTNGSSRRKQQRGRIGNASNADSLFAGQSTWSPPESGLKFEYVTRLDEFITDDDYDSSDEEADEDGGGIARRYNDHNITGGGPPLESAQDADGSGYLNPLAKAKLVHLLGRLPESNARLRKGDVARITAFAIEHAGLGADEVAAMITRNVIAPLSCVKQDGDSEGQEDGAGPGEEDGTKSGRDTSAASLVGLYIISDILSSSASAGVRHAWRYRALFENAIRQQQILEKLGRLDKDVGWGKLKAEKWKRSVNSILAMWEVWSVFPSSSHEQFVDNFNNPPLSEKEKRLAEREEKAKADAELQRTKSSTKWRSVEEEARQTEDTAMTDIDNVATIDEDVDGRPMDEDEESVTGEDIDGVPMVDSSDDEETRSPPLDSAPDGNTGLDQPGGKDHPAPVLNPAPSGAAPLKRQRMRAVDMFADESDAE